MGQLMNIDKQLLREQAEHLAEAPELAALLIRAADTLDSLPGGHQDISDDLRFEAEPKSAAKWVAAIEGVLNLLAALDREPGPHD